MIQTSPAPAVAICLAATAACLLPLTGRAAAQQTPPPDAEDRPALVGDRPTPTMPLDEVRIGMKGYGLTVFHGTRIEPFPVEVVSVIRDSAPKRGTIWIRSDEPRLAVSGPVQGMSGSPIFLWEEGEEGTLGEGGRLIGAFAYGYSWVKECLAGVQPIELMRRVGERSHKEVEAGAGDEAARIGSPAAALQTLGRLQQLATASGVSPMMRFRLDTIAELMRRNAAALGLPQQADGGSAPLPPAPPGVHAERGVHRMLLPLSIGSAEVAAFAAPLLEPMGIVPFATAPGASVAGAPPAGIDADAVRLQPGSVLSVPLAYGDIDLSASGTVTEVLPDGTVLGFGHAMFGQGDIALPLATGYVHFVVPRAEISFKQAGSLQIAGTITQDEMAAVAGQPEQTFDAAPMGVEIAMPGQPRESYAFHVVNHPQLTPVLAIIVAQQSMLAAQDLPTENTLRLTGSMTFTGDRTLPIDAVIPGGGPNDLFFELTPAIAAMMNNPHESLELQAIELSAEVTPTLQVGAIVHGRIDQAEVAPGDEVTFSVVVQPYGRPVQTFSGSLKIPAGLDEGDYQLMIVDATTYARLQMANRPHRSTTASVDDLAELIRETMAIRRDALYAVLQLPEQGIAVGRVELPQLPSSRRAIIATPTSTLASPFVETVEEKIDTGIVVQGQLAFTVAVRERLPAVQQQPAPGGRRPPQRRN